MCARSMVSAGKEIAIAARVEMTRALATTAIKDETLPCAGHNYQYGDMSENAILMHERRPLQ